MKVTELQNSSRKERISIIPRLSGSEEHVHAWKKTYTRGLKNLNYWIKHANSENNYVSISTKY